MEEPQTIRFVPARFLESFIAVARALLRQPGRFFEQLRPSGSLAGPLVFLFVCLFVASLFVANIIGAELPLFAAFFVSWSVAMVLGTMGSHAMLASPLFNARLPYEATLSVIAYANIVVLVAWIPLLGIIANMYGLYLMYLGFKTIHRLPAQRAGVAVFLTVLQVEFIRLIMIRMTAPQWLDSLIQTIESGSMPA